MYAIRSYYGVDGYRRLPEGRIQDDVRRLAADAGQPFQFLARSWNFARITSYNVCYTKLLRILSDEGHQVLLAESAGAARSLRERQRPDLVLLDIWMPDTDGITLLKEWSASGRLSMPVIMMSGHGTIETAVEATRIGALDFLRITSYNVCYTKLLRAHRLCGNPGICRARACTPARGGT